MNKEWTTHVQVTNKVYTSCAWTSYERGINKSWTSHEQVMIKSWTSDDQVIKKLWRSHSQLMNMLWTSHLEKRVMYIWWANYEKVKTIKSWLQKDLWPKKIGLKKSPSCSRYLPKKMFGSPLLSYQFQISSKF